MSAPVAKTPTRAQLFFAQNWPATIWFWTFPTVAVLLMASALGPAPDLTEWKAQTKGYLLLLGIALVLGLALGGLLGPFVLGPWYYHRSLLNGAPYQPGDRVLVLVGRNRGRVARVLEVWEHRDTLHVAWDDPAADGRKVYYGPVEVLRAEKPAPPVATSPATPAPS